jgi:hypothetical protein
MVYEDPTPEDLHMAAVLTSSTGRRSAGYSPSPIPSAVKNAIREHNIGHSDIRYAANDAVCKLSRSNRLCHVRHRCLLKALDRLENLLHRGELVFEAVNVVVGVVRHKVRPIVAITKATIGAGIRRIARFFGRWLDTAIGAALSPCGCGAILRGAIGLIAGGLLGAVIAHRVLA